MKVKELCWNITTRCNMDCRFCHKFINIEELSFDNNIFILHNIINSGVSRITWTGGEALLYKDIHALMKESSKNKIKNKLISNGSLLDNDMLLHFNGYLDSLTLSLDSVCAKTNTKLGRGEKHFCQINKVLIQKDVNNHLPKISLNTVISRVNIIDLEQLIDYINMRNVTSWRIFKFIPLRNISLKHSSDFAISDREFDQAKKMIINKCKVKKIEFRTQSEMEKDYILILANGDIVITEGGVDKIIGNALKDSLKELL